jgi:pyridoxine kinase
MNGIDNGYTGNHTGYKQVKGTKVTAEQIQDLYEGLKQSYLDEFDMMLSGYLPSPEAIQAVGKIGRGLQLKTRTRPGAFFWGSRPPEYTKDEVLMSVL